MMSKLWKWGRITLLMGLFGSSLPVLVNAVFGTPQVINQTSEQFTFPEQVPLSHWKAVNSEPIPATIGQHYRYRQNKSALDIEMRYIITSDENTDMQRLLRSYTEIPFTSTRQAVMSKHPATGFYLLFTYQQKAYLSACINSRGGSTVTEEQFRHNRNLAMLQLNQILAWLKEQKPLRDQRCLWVLMSLASTDTNPEAAYPILESVWYGWYSWWQIRFPAY